MKKTEINKILKKVEKAENLISKAHSDLSSIANYIQHLFDEEIDINWSTDGAVITTVNGEIGFLTIFLNGLFNDSEYFKLIEEKNKIADENLDMIQREFNKLPRIIEINKRLKELLIIQ